MKIKKQNNNYLTLTIVLLFIIGVIFASLYDLKINILLNNKDSTFGYVFKVFGEIPAFAILSLSANIFAIKLYKPNKTINIILSILLSILAVAFWLILLEKFLITEFFPNIHFLVTLLLSVLISYTTLFLMRLINKNTLNKLYKLALLAFISILVTAFITETIKLTFGRVRFRDLNSDYSNFTHWFIINGYTGNKSFISGHTSAAGSIFILNFIPNYFTKTKHLKPLFAIISFTYVALVALSRIIIGAHYLSDVLFGALVSYLSPLTINLLLTKNNNTTPTS